MRRILLTCWALCACSGGTYEIDVRLPDGVDASGLRLEVAVVPSCSGQDAEGPLVGALRVVELGDDTPALGDIDPGPYGLVGLASEGCRRVAFGCLDIRLKDGGEETFELALAPVDALGCAAGEVCVGSRCEALDAGGDMQQDALTMDAGDAGSDGGADVGVDTGSGCLFGNYRATVEQDDPLLYYPLDDAPEEALALGGTATTPAASYSGTYALGGPGASAATGTSATFVQDRDSPGELELRPEDVPGDAQFSVEFWLRLDQNAPANFMGLFVAETFPTSGFRIAIRETNRLYLSTVQNIAGMGTPTDVQDPLPVPIGVWQHYVLSIRDGVADIYRDGVRVAESPRERYITGGTRGGMGAVQGLFAGFTMDEFAYYDVPLTPEAIQAHFVAAQECE